jgi:mRNA degradation ribonuclease J1/J2
VSYPLADMGMDLTITIGADGTAEMHMNGEGERIRCSMQNSVLTADGVGIALQDGMLVVVVNISSEDGSVITGPDIITRGFVYVKESENLMEELRVIAAHAIDRCSQNGRSDWSVLKANIKNDLSGYLFKTTKRNPMILPVIMEI